MDQAKGDSQKIKEIQSKQLIGIEYHSHIFALAVSNMYIHQDAKTSIINCNCFDENIIKKVKKKATVAEGQLINRIKNKIQIILNNLECLVI